MGATFAALVVLILASYVGAFFAPSNSTYKRGCVVAAMNMHPTCNCDSGSFVGLWDAATGEPYIESVAPQLTTLNFFLDANQSSFAALYQHDVRLDISYTVWKYAPATAPKLELYCNWHYLALPASAATWSPFLLGSQQYLLSDHQLFIVPRINATACYAPLQIAELPAGFSPNISTIATSADHVSFVSKTFTLVELWFQSAASVTITSQKIDISLSDTSDIQLQVREHPFDGFFLFLH
jgi:hypothetical protein